MSQTNDRNSTPPVRPGNTAYHRMSISTSKINRLFVDTFYGQPVGLFDKDGLFFAVPNCESIDGKDGRLSNLLHGLMRIRSVEIYPPCVYNLGIKVRYISEDQYQQWDRLIDDESRTENRKKFDFFIGKLDKHPWDTIDA